MNSYKYKHFLDRLQGIPNKSYKDLIRSNIFTNTPVEIINKETFEIDLFRYLETINIRSIILSNKHFMLKSSSGELVWIKSYETFEELFYKLEKFLNKKTTLSPHIRNVILESVLYNTDYFKISVYICKMGFT